MEILDKKDDYKAPQAKVFEVKVEGMLCQSVGDYNNPFGDDPDSI